MPSSLGQAMADMVGRGRGDTDWRAMRNELVELFGTISGAARAADISRRTWRYWIERETAGKMPRPKESTVTRLREALYVARAPRDSEVVLRTQDRADQRARTLTGRKLRLAEGTMERVARALAQTGQPDAAAQVFLAGVGDPWYAGYLAPRRDEFGEDADDLADDLADDYPDEDADELEDVAEQSFDDWYEDAQWEDYFVEPDSPTFSGGTVAGVG